MSENKRMNKRYVPARSERKAKRRKEKQFVLALGLILCSIISYVTVAFLVTATAPLTNTFTPSHVACAVIENNSENEIYSGVQNVSSKSDVMIKNTGDTEAYIRAKVVVTWMKSMTVNDNGSSVSTVYATAPGYTINGTSTKWIEGEDGYWYYTEPVAPGGFTDELIDSLTIDSANAPEGYKLSVEIIASAIQSTPTRVVVNSWSSVSSVDGTKLEIQQQ